MSTRTRAITGFNGAHCVTQLQASSPDCPLSRRSTSCIWSATSPPTGQQTSHHSTRQKCARLSTSRSTDHLRPAPHSTASPYLNE
jgi:hypothetical protein